MSWKAPCIVLHAGSVRQFKQVLPDEKSLRDLGLKPGDRVWSLEGGRPMQTDADRCRPMQTDADRMRESKGMSWMKGTLPSRFFWCHSGRD